MIAVAGKAAAAKGVRGQSQHAAWDRIEKIERLPAEQVWDLEIAGTHNFVANGIVAHNTYLSNLLATASSTIGDGTQAGGLTISGGATTTGNLVVQGSATSTFTNGIQASYLNINGGSASSTFANGINLSGGCFSVNGSCFTSGSASAAGGTGAVQFANGANFAGDTSNFFWNNTSKRLGIGTSSPQASLEINNQSAATTSPLYLTNLQNATSTAVGFEFRTQDITNGLGTSTAKILSILQQNFNGGKGDLAFFTLNNGTLTEAARISAAGWLGIGTTSPGSILSISGVGNFTSATSTLYGDLSIRNFNVGGTASSTFGNGIVLNGGCFLYNGVCLSTASSITGSANTWTQLQTFQGGVFSQASSTFSVLTTFTGGASTTVLSVSETGYFTTASTSNLTVSGLQNSLLATNGTGVVVATSTPSAQNFFATSNIASQFPFASSTAISVSGTSFLTNIFATASSTIGSGAQAGGLTVFGGATTTANLNVLGTGTSTFSWGLQAATLNISSTTATSTFANGIQIAAGCFAVNGVCVTTGGGSVDLVFASAIDELGTTVVSLTGLEQYVLAQACVTTGGALAWRLASSTAALQAGRPWFETAESLAITTIYVDNTAGSDTAGTGTAANPFASIEKAFTLIPVDARVDRIVQLVASVTNYTIPYIFGWNRVTIQGPAPTVTEAAVVNADLAAPSTAATQIYCDFVAAAWAGDVYRGRIGQWDAATTTVALRSTYGVVMENTATDMRITSGKPGTVFTAAAATDTFNVLAQGAAIQITGTANINHIIGHSAGLVFADLEFNGNGTNSVGIDFHHSSVIFNRCRLGGTVAADTTFTYADTATVQPYFGVYKISGAGVGTLYVDMVRIFQASR